MHYHLRRTDRAITDETVISRILREGHYVTIALADGEQPYVVTLSYGLSEDERRLYFHVAREGRKLDIIARNPLACATVIIDHGYNMGECEHPFESVVMHGRIRVLDDVDDKRRAIHALVNHLEADPEGYWASRSWQLEPRLAGFTGLVFEIESLEAKAGS